jgi:hypothetical protein
MTGIGRSPSDGAGGRRAEGMGHELIRKSGELPSPQAIVALLRQEFRYVRSDPELALQAVAAQAAWIRRVNPAVFLGHHVEALAHAETLERLTAAEVLWVEFGDAEDQLLHFAFWPGATIKFGYAGAEDEAQAQPLIARCAGALGCRVEEF